MIVQRSTSEIPRSPSKWEDRWGSLELGLLTSWERGRVFAKEQPRLAEAAIKGELPNLPWKGGLSKKRKNNGSRKYGSLYYLAFWQGLRGDDLSIDTEQAVTIVCSRFESPVTFTNDIKKYGASAEDHEEDVTED